MVKQVSRFSFIKGRPEPTPSDADSAAEETLPNPEDPRIQRVMQELERNMDYIDEHNPKHLAYLMKKMKEIMPASSVPPELDIAIKRLESGEDPEKVEEDMSEVLSEFLGGPVDGTDTDYSTYSRDEGLYEM